MQIAKLFKLGLSRKFQKRVLLIGAALTVAAGKAMASSSGSMPWDSTLTILSNDLTGPTAYTVGTIAIFAAGGVLVFGREELHGFVKTICYIVLAVALLINGPNIMQLLGSNQGALIF